MPFHRNFLETAALSITANGGAINWAALRALLDPNGGAELDAVRATRVVSRKEVAQQRRLSFHELSQRCTARGLGVLIGWRRAREAEDTSSRKISQQLHASNTSLLHTETVHRPVINPIDKDQALEAWRPADRLLLVRSTSKKCVTMRTGQSIRPGALERPSLAASREQHSEQSSIELDPAPPPDRAEWFPEGLGSIPVIVEN